jgi:hypothetical protein
VKPFEISTMVAPHEITASAPFTIIEEHDIECHACGKTRPVVLCVYVYNLCQHFVGLCPEHFRALGSLLIAAIVPGDKRTIAQLCHKCANGENVFRGVREWVHGGAGGAPVRCAASDLRDAHYGPNAKIIRHQTVTSPRRP